MPVTVKKRTFLSVLERFSVFYFCSSVAVKAVSTFFSFTPAFKGFDQSHSLLRFTFSSPTATVIDFSFSMNFIASLLSNFKFFYGFSQIRTFFSLFRALHLGSRRPYFVKFSMKGVGYRVWSLRGKAFYFRLGFTHRIVFYLPPHVTFRRRKYKFVLLSFDFARLTQVAKYLLSLRVPDVYKGKGIRYVGDRVFTKSRLKDAKKRLKL